MGRNLKVDLHPVGYFRSMKVPELIYYIQPRLNRFYHKNLPSDEFENMQNALKEYLSKGGDLDYFYLGKNVPRNMTFFKV